MGCGASRCGVLLGLAAALAAAGCGDGSVKTYGSVPAEVLVCAGSSILNGVDVSVWQGGSIDWYAVAAEGNTFAFIRVSYGINTIDKYFAVNWTGAKNAGVIRGAYQYFRPSQDAAVQAQVLLDNMGPLKDGDLPPVIDVEQTDGLTGPEIAAKVGEWIEHIEAALGVKPIIYTGRYFWEDNVGSSAFVSYPLWLPYYEVVCPNTPAPWKGWKFWQWTSSGTVDGIPGDVDQDIFNGSIEELKAMTFGCGNGTCNQGETGSSCPDDCLPLSFVTPLDGDTKPNPVTFRVTADPSVVSVNYFAEVYKFGTSADSVNGFEVSYKFNQLGERQILAEGFDKDGKRIAAEAISITIIEAADGGFADAGADGGEALDADTTDAVTGDAGEGDAFISPEEDRVDAGWPDAGVQPDGGQDWDSGDGAVTYVVTDAGSDGGAYIAVPDETGCSCSTVGVK